MTCDISVAFWLFSGLVMAGFWSCYQNKWKISLRRITNHSPNHPFQPRKKMVQLPFPFTDSFSLPTNLHLCWGLLLFRINKKHAIKKQKKTTHFLKLTCRPWKKWWLGDDPFASFWGPTYLVSGRVYRAKNDKKHNPSNLQSFRGILCSV